MVSGNGEGKLLILKDSYANRFSQFVISDYTETHLIDPCFYKDSVTNYVEKNGIGDGIDFHENWSITSVCRNLKRWNWSKSSALQMGSLESPVGENFFTMSFPPGHLFLLKLWTNSPLSAILKLASCTRVFHDISRIRRVRQWDSDSGNC